LTVLLNPAIAESLDCPNIGIMNMKTGTITEEYGHFTNSKKFKSYYPIRNFRGFSPQQSRGFHTFPLCVKLLAATSYRR